MNYRDRAGRKDGCNHRPLRVLPPQLCLVGVFFIAVACGNSLMGVLRTSGALALGECSFGIYLFLGIALSLLFVDGSGLIVDLTAAQVVFLLPLVGLVVACVTPFAYVLIERPMIVAGHRIARSLTGRKRHPEGPPLRGGGWRGRVSRG